MKKLFFSLVGLLVFLGALWPVQAFDVPEYQGPVNDFGQIIDDEAEQKLETQLENLALQENGAELAVVTVPGLEGETIEQVAQQFFDSWQIGKKGIDNGVLLLVAVEDRELRIQTGYGTEGVIPDAVAGRIIRDDITPYFKDGRFTEGIEVGSQRIIAYLDDPEAFVAALPEEKSETEEVAWVALIYTLFIMGMTGGAYVAAFFGRSKAWWPGGLVGLILGWLVGQLPAGIFFGLLGLLLDYILSKNWQAWNMDKRTQNWQNSWGGFKGPSSTRSSGSSFGFGGGRSGGGGASGRW